MELPVVLGAAAVIGAIAMLWWGVTARPSAARTNLFDGLGPVDDDAPDESPSLLSRVGTTMRVALPRSMVDGLEVNLIQAGHPHGLDLPRILGLKLILSATTALLLVIAGRPLWALFVAAAVFFLPDYWVLTERDKRQAEMEIRVADIVDQLTICVEAGLGFDAALARVATTTDGPLTDELRRTITDIQIGVPRSQALRMFADRAQIAEVRQLVTALLQAQKHGVPIGETLRLQSAEMRLKRKQRTEEMAAKLTVKLLFPIVICFLPVFMIITAGPAFLSLGGVL